MVVPSIDKLEHTIQTIREQYAIGQQLFRECGLTADCRTLKPMAFRLNINYNTSQKLRALANPMVGFTKAELEAMFRKFRKVGRALTVTHLILLLSVPKGKNRDQLLELSLTHKWSKHQLQREINIRKPGSNARKAGRRPAVNTAQDFELSLSQIMVSWRRLLTLQLQENPNLSPELQQTLQGLEKSISHAIEQLQWPLVTEDG